MGWEKEGRRIDHTESRLDCRTFIGMRERNKEKRRRKRRIDDTGSRAECRTFEWNGTVSGPFKDD